MSDVTTQSQDQDLDAAPDVWGRIQEFFDQWGHRLPLAFFIGGFILDNFTLTRIDRAWEITVFTLHLINLTLMVVLMQLAWRVKRKRGGEKTEEVQVKSIIGDYAAWYPNIFQLSLGALFSAFFIFFSRSGALAGSWPFIALLVAFLIGNEVFKERYERFVFQMSVYYFVLLLFLILFVPVIFGKIGVSMFILSGIASLGFFICFIYLLNKIIRERVQRTLRTLSISVGSIFVVMNILYFANIIPPIPLAMKDIGVYHSVTRLRDGNYQVQYEKPRWYQFFKSSEKNFNRAPGMSVYVYSSVFAPTKLSTNIFHHWQYYDESSDDWISSGRVSYEITGGRDGGFRGYSFKDNIFPGKWRVDVETARGQLLGRKRFTLELAEKQPELVTEVK